jgi:hypothetical protein
LIFRNKTNWIEELQGDNKFLVGQKSNANILELAGGSGN